MIDLSDGLSSDILQICKSSQCGCRIYQEKIPIDTETAQTAKELNMEPLIAALNGGEDYELLFTVPVSEFEKVNEIPGISIIGHITSEKEGCYLITEAEQAVEIQAQGWS
jgi:thiamine-monophosphate kinase